jgi:hypothetical protein
MQTVERASVSGCSLHRGIGSSGPTSGSPSWPDRSSTGIIDQGCEFQIQHLSPLFMPRRAGPEISRMIRRRYLLSTSHWPAGVKSPCPPYVPRAMLALVDNVVVRQPDMGEHGSF